MAKTHWQHARTWCATTLSALALSMGSVTAHAEPAQTEAICTARGYTVAFFNGTIRNRKVSDARNRAP